MSTLEMNGRPVAGVVFDVDGTLYSQGPLRLMMALELSVLPITLSSLTRARRTWRIISAFRKAREEIRGLSDESTPLARLEYEVPAQRLGIPADELQEVVEEWMYRRPLKYLAYCRKRHLVKFLARLEELGVPVGVLSDYPAEDKLRALGVNAFVDVVLCSTDERINAFKPEARGFLLMAELLGVPPAEILYIGDRMEVDGVGALASGMMGVIVGNVSADTGRLGLGVSRARTYASLAKSLCL